MATGSNSLNNFLSTISNLIGNPVNSAQAAITGANTTAGLADTVSDAGGGTSAFPGMLADMQKDALQATQQQAQMTKFQNQVNTAQNAIQIEGKLEKGAMDKMNIM